MSKSGIESADAFAARIESECGDDSLDTCRAFYLIELRDAAIRADERAKTLRECDYVVRLSVLPDGETWAPGLVRSALSLRLRALDGWKDEDDK